MAAAPKQSEFVLVRTTRPNLPFPPAETRPFTTERLLMRPFQQDDLAAVRELRTQPEVMRWTSIGRVDASLAESQANLALYLPPNDTHTYNFALCLKDTGELIGMGGCHKLEGHWGWPDVGYMFQRESWGKGYATEFLKGFLEAWVKLPRSETEIAVDPRTVIGVSAEGGLVEEQLLATTEELNSRSHHVLTKSGFEHFLTSKAANEQHHNEDAMDLPTFRYFPSRNNSI